MFSIKSTVLTAALVGHGALSVAAQGCYPTYSSGSNYVAGDTVSADTTTSTTTTSPCSPAGTSTCPSTGITTTTTTTTTTHNYECSAAWAAFCNDGAYAPGDFGTNPSAAGLAWVEIAVCSGSATPPAVTPGPTPALWSGGGCPNAFSTSADYAAGDLVTVAGSAFSTVYRCNSSPADQWCDLNGYEPGTGIAWAQAWTALGSCTGSIAPTSSPNYVSLADAGGCPSAYVAGTAYEDGDRVSLDGLVYQCNSLHCPQVGYEPGTSIGSGATVVEYWRLAWTVVGFCSGTIAPTTSPNFVTLADMGGCPDGWVAQPYEEGDRVSDGTLVYECRAWPQSGWCGQAGYEPNVNPATPDAWKDAWTVKGFCSGTIAPTTSPNFNPATSVGACPDEWVAGSNVAYEEGDMVSLTVSASPLRKVVFRCKAWPFSGFCGQLAPDVFGGDQGWEPAGSCDGSIGPTQSPSFDTLQDSGLGCPQAWSGSTTDYEAGDLVSYAVSASPMRKLVFECRAWPNSGYCNQGSGFEPTTTYANLAWTPRGYCDGTLAPTAAPVVFVPGSGCTFNKCVDVPTTQSCTNGSTGCTCTGTGSAQVCTRTVDVQDCSAVVGIQPWSSGGLGTTGTYVVNDVVRLGAQRYRCRAWPNELWCPIETYRPTREANGLWTQAWVLDGTCT